LFDSRCRISHELKEANYSLIGHKDTMDMTNRHYTFDPKFYVVPKSDLVRCARLDRLKMQNRKMTDQQKINR